MVGNCGFAGLQDCLTLGAAIVSLERTSDTLCTRGGGGEVAQLNRLYWWSCILTKKCVHRWYYEVQSISENISDWKGRYE